MSNKLKTAAVTLALAIGLLIPPIGLPAASIADAAEIKVLSSNVFTGVLDELARAFESQTGHHITIVYETAGVIRRGVQGGEPGDVAILSRPMSDEVVGQGKIVPGSVVDVARSAVGVAVRAGAPKPDIGSVDAFKRALAAAQSISYADPARGGATGLLVTRVFARLGIAEEMKPKTKFPPPGGFAVEVVAKGAAALALAQPMEVLSLGGVDLVIAL
jgi:molybdate transport system substrate-binding protein